MMVLLAKHIDNLSDEVNKGMAEKVQEGGFPHQAPLATTTLAKAIDT
jgi:hypothetical protein